MTALKDLKRVENRRGTHLQEDVPKTLLGHIERLLGVEHSFVERREAVEVVGQEVEMVDAFKKRHEPRFTGSPRVQRGLGPHSRVGSHGCSKRRETAEKVGTLNSGSVRPSA